MIVGSWCSPPRGILIYCGGSLRGVTRRSTGSRLVRDLYWPGLGLAERFSGRILGEGSPYGWERKMRRRSGSRGARHAALRSASGWAADALERRTLLSAVVAAADPVVYANTVIGTVAPRPGH